MKVIHEFYRQSLTRKLCSILLNSASHIWIRRGLFTSVLKSDADPSYNVNSYVHLSFGRHDEGLGFVAHDFNRSCGFKVNERVCQSSAYTVKVYKRLNSNFLAT